MAYADAIPSSESPAAEPRRALLRVTHPSRGPILVPLTRSHVVMGRAEDADLMLDSQSVSRHHAELVQDPFQRWWVRDRQSRNGTRVNGHAVRESLIRPGDVVQIGEFLLALTADDATGDAAPPPSSYDSGRTYADARLTVMPAPAERIQRLREFQAPKIGHAHLTAVLEFGHALNVTPDDRERLARLCRLVVISPFPGRAVAAVRVARTDPAAVQMLLEPEAGHAPPTLSASVLRAVCESPEPVLATNRGQAGQHNIELSISADVVEMSVVAVPLRVDEQTVDLLYVSLAPECGHSDWLALVALAAKQYQQAEAVWRNVGRIKEYAAIERDLERAQQIQRRLIPKQLTIPGLETAIGFEPCNWVGGDYVDVVPLRDGRVLLIVADVCGKGLPAALVSSSLHTMVHAGARAGEGPVALANALNEYVCDYLGEQSFATMICVAIDAATGACETVCAGHPHGLIIGPTGDVRLLRARSGLPLGLEPIPHVAAVDKLAPGEVLALFTDGLTELRAESEDMLGADGLADGLAQLYAIGATRPLAELVDQLNGCLDAFRGNAIVADDRTFLLARLTAVG
ncbi:MAG: SpoIIE family protein phosphatase [Phycisphaerae bacterium]